MLLGLDGPAVDHVELDVDGTPVVHVIKEWVIIRPRDLPSGGESIRLTWHKQRWRCRSAECPKRTFGRRCRSCRLRSD
ncbi:transposase family protein [Kutzneria buriramensis]|uniref:transposase family protein n=1 Tax=Kutzneria buriramensis TaxID=1045776 RepID=UPI001B886CC1|nr:transposase family protein [Kutzneria buriramensis]